MSLEMIANPDFELGDINRIALSEALRILNRCCVIDVVPDGIADEMMRKLRLQLLTAARQELLEIKRYLTSRHIIWGSFWHRDERAVLRPYWKLSRRQAFQDGVRIALLLVAVRQARIDEDEAARKLPHARKIAQVAAAISGDSEYFKKALGHFPAMRAKQPSITARLRTRRWPSQCRTPSWPAAYNLACAYAALAETPGLDCPVTKVVSSLQFAVCNPECEMERPSEWITSDPDLSRLSRIDNDFAAFLDDQRERDYLVATSLPGRRSCDAGRSEH
jgi:hypothetical protein